VSATPPKTREAFLAAPLGELAAYWLDLRCHPELCTKVVCAPLRLMAAKHGRGRRLEELLARLRCAQCGQRPARVRITDSAVGLDSGGNHVAPRALWELELVP